MHEGRLPNIQENERTLSYWLALWKKQQRDLEAPVLSAAEIKAHNGALSEKGAALEFSQLLSPVDRKYLYDHIKERIDHVRAAIEENRYVDEAGKRPSLKKISHNQVPLAANVGGRLYVALEEIPIRCAPYNGGLYKKANPDRDFDRNRCSTLHPQEAFEKLQITKNGMWLVRTPYTFGFIDPRRASIEVPEEHREIYARGPYAFSTQFAVPIPRSEDGRILVAGKTFTYKNDNLTATATARALTRKAFYAAAFSELDKKYGWGGKGLGYDCSRFLLEVFRRFNLKLPRHSSKQAQAGSHTIDVPETLGASERLKLLDEAQASGVVLLHFPGHIMLYLGTNAANEPRALHAFSEYLEPCKNGKETIVRVDRVDVSDLSLGKNTSRRSFLERITKIAIFGESLVPSLRDVTIPRRAALPELNADAECRDNVNAAIFRSPRKPLANRRLRVLLTTEKRIDDQRFVIRDPMGNLLEPEVHRLGGPPYSAWTEIARPIAGRYRALIGDGNKITACEDFTVSKHADVAAPGNDNAWKATWKWERDTENFFSAFVEQLFLEPQNEETTWPNLQTLIGDPTRNLLHNHFGENEDAVLNLEPDCADLPYFLRSYFAWKLRLPFAYRRCGRGRAKSAPTCGALYAHAQPVAGDNAARYTWLRKDIANAVHSSTQRTLPDDNETDVYPIALSRDAIRPGVVYADPYGHVMIVARWKNQTLSDYGALIAADAQPDGTVGRRTFSRGSFLFTPDTEAAGAGFKAWRPVSPDTVATSEDLTPGPGVVALDNRSLKHTKDFARFSTEQYEGDKDAFYDRVEALANPRPLDAHVRLRALVDALHESAIRRVNSVDNGEDFMRKRNFAPIDMPDGSAIFQTVGAWEDYATPSRDMRLLIAIDAVMRMTDQVKSNPERFGIAKEDSAVIVKKLREQMDSQLAKTTITYQRSDGSTQTVTLKELIARQKNMEMAYNPNDCIEIRWGANKKEMKTCKRHAPRNQRAKMQKYRAWFSTRERPAR